MSAFIPVINVTGTDLNVSKTALWAAGVAAGTATCTESAQVANQVSLPSFAWLLAEILHTPNATASGGSSPSSLKLMTADVATLPQGFPSRVTSVRLCVCARYLVHFGGCSVDLLSLICKRVRWLRTLPSLDFDHRASAHHLTSNPCYEWQLVILHP